MGVISRHAAVLAMVCYFLALSAGQGLGPRVGGLSSEQPINNEVIQVVKDVKEEVEAKLEKSLEIYNVVSYKTQTVAGTNYFVKVQISPNEYIHVRIYESFSGDVSLTSVSQDKTAEEEITYFD